MENKYCQVLISAISKEEADKISWVLVNNKLIAGSLINKGDSRYWWKGEVKNEGYYNIQCFSLIKNKDKIINKVKEIHSDKCPIVAFFLIDGNEEFLKWIDDSLQ